MLKTCTRCKITKNILEFYKKTTTKDRFVSQCKDCHKVYAKQNKDKIAKRMGEYRKQNKEKLAEQRKEYKENNKQKLSEYNKKYHKDNRDTNREKISEYQKAYYAQNREKILDRVKDHCLKNKERIKEYRKEHYIQNKDSIKAYKRKYNKTPNGKMVKTNAINKRRFIKRQTSDGTIPFSITYPLTKELQTLLELQDNKCYLCNFILEKKHLDHYVPLSKGGTHSIDNVVWLCPTCNLCKGVNVPSELLLI